MVHQNQVRSSSEGFPQLDSLREIDQLASGNSALNASNLAAILDQFWTKPTLLGPSHFVPLTSSPHRHQKLWTHDRGRESILNLAGPKEGAVGPCCRLPCAVLWDRLSRWPLAPTGVGAGSCSALDVTPSKSQSVSRAIK